MEPSNIFGNVKIEPSNSSRDLPSKLTIDELEEFRQMMLGDKVIVGCDEVIEEFEDEVGLLECLIYLWQQNSQKFRLNLPLPIREWFLSNFVDSNRDDVKNLTFYKGMHFKRDGSVDLNSIHHDGSFISSTTTDYEMAKDFAFGYKNRWLENNHICCIYKITGESVFDVKPYRDFDEEEFIIYKPKFELLEVLN